MSYIKELQDKKSEYMQILKDILSKTRDNRLIVRAHVLAENNGEYQTNLTNWVELVNDGIVIDLTGCLNMEDDEIDIEELNITDVANILDKLIFKPQK